MKKHEKNSHSEKCEICDYCCKNSRNLKIHGKKVHEKNPQCKTCSSISDNDYELKDDKETCHEFQCEICDSFSETSRYSKNHAETEHKKNPKHNCNICGKNFAVKVEGEEKKSRQQVLHYTIKTITPRVNFYFKWSK